MDNRTLYFNGNIVTGLADQLFLPGGWFLVGGSRILAAGEGSDCPAASKRVNLQGRIVAPGMVSVHGHFYGQFVRGMPLGQPVANWQQVLSRVWWKLDKALDEEQVYYSAMMGLVEGLKAGTTTYFDHHASPNFISGSLDVLETAMAAAGGRGCFAYEVTDRDGRERALQGIRENERYIRKHTGSDQRYKGIFGLHASYTLSDETLEQCSKSGNALGSGFHMHLAESEADVLDGYKQYDMHVTERMERFDILGEKTIAAHCVHLSAKEFEILRRTNTTAVYNCQSNANNAVGICRRRR
jgi:cytosine/adenosine deaminase-related metal-dependent hydrolase